MDLGSKCGSLRPVVIIIRVIAETQDYRHEVQNRCH
jgi:hypothetical protein